MQLKITLAAARVNAGLTQEDVANIMKVTKRTVINWEHGKVIPSLATTEKLAQIYKIPINNIFLPSKST
ncbi:MAG: helix-turn-helix transcriptional regulator [Clostridium sp.]|nr:helix-turn-helix transcriptional regulator [Clostridium sp.]MCM1208984.1 helix-turn-helix transcriptional regulator [Ruminococcus sp.]